MKKISTRKLTISALLIALGILIPMVMPRIQVGPASFTLASHVPVFLAMFISPGVAIAVTLGTTIGFFISTGPIIAMRALSHVIFAVIGSLYLQKNPKIVLNKFKFTSFNIVISIIHAACEMLVVTGFFMYGNMPEAYYSQGYIYTVFLLMGIGGFIHSMIDYTIAYVVAGRLSKHFDIPVYTKARAAAYQESKKITA